MLTLDPVVFDQTVLALCTHALSASFQLLWLLFICLLAELASETAQVLLPRLLCIELQVVGCVNVFRNRVVKPSLPTLLVEAGEI